MMILEMEKNSSLLNELFSIKILESFAWSCCLENYMQLCKKDNANANKDNKI